MTRKYLSGNGITHVLFVAISAVILAEILLNLTPPVSRDALVHHLALPKIWLSRGIFSGIPGAEFSSYPMNIDLLYYFSLKLGSDILPKFIHFAFGMGIGFLIYGYLAQRAGKNWGLLGVLVFFSTPVVIRLSTSAYIDLGMVFFTTASILAWIRWQGEGYRRMRWFVLSAVCMGLAAGSKYSALIAWFFLNLMVVFYYARDTKKQLPALRYGFLFLVITLLVVSPWYIKNYIQTGNPVHPLFDHFFAFIRHAGETGGVAATLSNDGWAANIFQRRALLYGESFWETLAIPIRIFFQGQDNSSRYFDGVLNPIFIIFFPFAFMRKNLHRETVLFASFSFFFIIVACFFSVIRVRYLMPVIPFMTILSVSGMRNLITWIGKAASPISEIGVATIVSAAIVLLAFNFSYMVRYFGEVQPVKYLLHQETRDEFITRHVASYPAVRYINETLPEDSRICLLFLGRRGYYLDRPYRHEPSFGMGMIDNMVRASRTEADMRACLESLWCTHLLVRKDLFHKYLRDTYGREEHERFLKVLAKQVPSIYDANGYSVMEIHHGT